MQALATDLLIAISGVRMRIVGRSCWLIGPAYNILDGIITLWFNTDLYKKKLSHEMFYNTFDIYFEKLSVARLGLIMS